MRIDDPDSMLMKAKTSRLCRLPGGWERGLGALVMSLGDTTFLLRIEGLGGVRGD